jgi:hypothetical protein
MRADASKLVPAGARGRDSVRITSPPHSNTDEAVIVLDLQHMPEGCATWPAWWTLSASGPWPHGGEIDIIEGGSRRVFPLYTLGFTLHSLGVNRNNQNLASMHTSPGCTMSQSRPQKGCVSVYPGDFYTLHRFFFSSDKLYPPIVTRLLTIIKAVVPLSTVLTRTVLVSMLEEADGTSCTGQGLKA